MAEMNNEKIKTLKSILKTMDKFIKLAKRIKKLPAAQRKMLEAKIGGVDDKATEALIKDSEELRREIKEIEKKEG